MEKETKYFGGYVWVIKGAPGTCTHDGAPLPENYIMSEEGSFCEPHCREKARGKKPIGAGVLRP